MDVACTPTPVGVQHTLSGASHARTYSLADGGAAVFDKIFSHCGSVLRVVRLCKEISN